MGYYLEKANLFNKKEFEVGVVVALYNGEKHIKSALLSINSQTLLPLEVFVVDDGSNDRGPEIVKQMISDGLLDSKMFKIIEQQNSGQGKARNTGVAALSTSHVAFLDQDDAWGELHLEQLMHRMQNSPNSNIGWVYSDFSEIDDNSRLIRRDFLKHSEYSVPTPSIFSLLGQDLMMLPSASLVLKQAFDEVGGFDSQFRGYEDDDLFVRMFLSGWTFDFEPYSNVYYRIHDNNSSGGTTFLVSRKNFFLKMSQIFEKDSNYRQHLVQDFLAPRIIRSYITDGYASTIRKDWKTLKAVEVNLKDVAKNVSPNYKGLAKLKLRLVTLTFSSKGLSKLASSTWRRFATLRASKRKNQ